MEALLWAALANAALAGVLAVVAALAGRLWRRRPALVHALWLLVLLKLITPPLLRPELAWPRPEGAEQASEPALPMEQPECPACAAPREVVAADAEEVPLTLDQPEPPSDGPGWSWPPAVLAVWLAGAAAYWLMALTRLARLYRLIRKLPEAPAEVQQRVATLAERLGVARPPRAWLVPGPVCLPPLVVALAGSPRLLLPAPLWQGLDEAQREALVLHELAHLRRGDQRLRWLELVVLGLYWWYPVAWWACRRLRQAEELCCDAWVVWAAPESAADYAAALVETVAYLSNVPRRSLVGVSAAGPLVELERRLHMIFAARTPRRLSRPAGALVVVAGLALLPLVPTLARTETAPAATAAAEAPAVNEKGAISYPNSCLACHVAVTKKPELPTAHLHDEVVRLMNEVAAQKARLAAAEKKLREALARFEKAHPKPAAKPAPEAGPRLRQLDQKLERLLKEVEQLRREMRRARPAKEDRGPSTRAPGDEVLYINQRNFKVPIRIVKERRATVRELVLYVSRDQGRTWEVHARATPDREAFNFASDRDGPVWFKVAVIDRQGKQEPADLALAPVSQKIHVDTTLPVVKLQRGTGTENRVRLEWHVSDDHLDLSTLRLEVRYGDKGTWQPLAPRQPFAAGSGACDGAIAFSPSSRPWTVRVSVADRAGNVGTAQLGQRARDH
jgi:beta-lactamase regulating signal transducer with metallopeptidase domain